MHTTLFNIVVIPIVIVDDFLLFKVSQKIHIKHQFERLKKIEILDYLVYNVKFVLLKVCGCENLKEFCY
jgi:hypothetical protein